MDHDRARARFRHLHEAGTFTMPNAFDAGSARLLEDLGAEAIATTSSGYAATQGRLDMTTTRDELVAHVAALCAATSLPVSVDAEQCYPDDPGGVAATVAALADAGAAGCSIEDWDPALGRLVPLDVATDRVSAAAAVARERGLVLTARAENHLRGVDDLDDTIGRLCAYRDAGAGCVYAPGLVDLASIARVVAATATPVNVLLLAGGPGGHELAGAGVRRLSVGGRLASVAYGAVWRAAQRLLATGAIDPDDGALDRDVARRAFAAR
ncbi:MAG TPA: isocitrate lyase/phosphoenolpyruvate mutase family protein [Acidimicrobiales bacterium]|nr:isocitrate lyase/phosphoenolpyruvate mutase family protein [Acidimicrobiales bacterium]